jgi:competence protein ComEC
MRRTFGIVFALILACALPSAQTRSKTLDIYVVDTEGGKATLFVSPSGESLLIDAGNPGGRDTDRIMAVVADAGLKQIDYLLLTHYHVDHVGGVQELAKRIPIKHFLDHGPSVEAHEQVAGFQQAYAELYGKASHTVVKAGDPVPIAGLDWRIVTSAGKAITSPLPGGGKPNPYCAEFMPRENLRDPENGQSVGSVVTFGKFRTIDLGDLLWNNEGDLMCPTNPIGTVDLYLVSHHGTDPSGSTALVHALAPRVAIMQNGTRKGGTVQTLQTLHTSPGLEDIWQLHWAYNGGIEQNPSGLFIANIDDPETLAEVITTPPGASRGMGPGGAPPAGSPPGGAPGSAGGRGGHTGPANLIKVSAQADGSFTVTNTRNQFTKTYRAVQR